MEFFKKYGYWIIFFQALIAMLGSLYYSHFWDPYSNIITGHLFDFERGYEPCTLCWYARILMYPIVWLSLIDILKKQISTLTAIKFMSWVGILLELYHYSLQKFDIDVGTVCTKAHPCNAMYVDYFNFITIPYLCLIAFTVIFVTAHLMTWKKESK